MEPHASSLTMVGIQATGLWIGRTNNGKTSDVPSLYVGKTREESKESCGACPLLKRNSADGKARCYAQHGTPAMAHAQMVKTARDNPSRYSFERAMGERRAGAAMARFGAVGDPAGIPRATLEPQIFKVRALGMRAVGYTSQYDEPHGQWLKPHFMASAKSDAEADRLVAEGWRATGVVEPGFTPRKTEGGNWVVLCPAIAAERKGRKLTCNQCTLCDGSQDGPIVAFPDHGPGSRKKIKRTQVFAATKREAIAKFKTLHTNQITIGVRRPKRGAGWIVSSVAA